MASRLKYQSMVNHFLSIFILTQVINLSYVASLAPQIKDLKVQCDSDGMEVNVTFDSPFNGIIFSKGYYNDMGCRYVQEKSGSSNLAFKIPAEGCGTASVLSKDVKDSKQFENVIIFQNDPIYQEVWDSARLLSCRYSLQRDLPIQEKRVVFKPFLVDMLDVIRVPMADFAGDEHKVDCWMDVTKGRYPNNSPIDGPVKVGENLTLAIYIRDTRKRTDIRVKDCYAYDNEESVNDKSPALLQLSGEDGCPLKPKLMDVWKRTTTGASDATVLAYSTVTAFKFPEHSNVHLTCNVELCKNQCADRCSLEAKDIANKKGEASTDGEDEMSKSSESKSDGEDDDDDSSSNKNDESDVKPVSISTKAAPAAKSDSTKSEDDEDEDSNADEEAKTETTSAKPTTASSVKDADEDEDAASEDAAEGSTSERGGRKSDGEDNEEDTDEETSVGSSTSTTTSTTTAKPSEDEDEEEDKSDEEDEDKKSETSPTTTTSTTSTTSTTTTTTTTTEKPSERSEDDEEDEDGVDDSDTDSRKRSLRPSKAEGKSIADDEDEDEEDNSSKLISFKAKQSMKTKAEASEDEDYDDDLQSSRGSSTSVSPVTTTTTPIPKTPLIIVIKPEKSRKKIKEAARRGRIESRSRQAVRSSSSKLGSSRSISSQVSREPCCSDVTTTSSRSDRKSTTSTTKSPITARSSSGRSVRRSSRFDEPDSENVSNLQSKSQRSSRQSKKQAKTTTTTTTTSTTVAPKKIKTTSTKRPRRRSSTTTTTTTTTPRTTTESDEDKEETEAPRTFRKSTRKPKRPVVRTRKSLTDRLFIPHSNDRQTTPKTVTTTISPSISSSSTFRIASNRFSTHRSNPYLRSTLKPATIPSSRNSLRLTSSSTVAPPKRLADFDEFKDNEALIENEKPDRNRIKPSSSSAATGASRRWDGDELFNPFKEMEYEPVRLNNNRNQRRRRSLYTLFNGQHTDEKLSNYNMPIIF